MTSGDPQAYLNIRCCINQFHTELTGLIRHPKYSTSLQGQNNPVEMQSPIFFKGIFFPSTFVFQQLLDMCEVLQPIFRKPTTAAIIWRNERLLSSHVFIYPTDITFYVYVFRGSLQPNARYTHDIDVDLNVGKVQKVKFLWYNHIIDLFHPELGASQVMVQSGEDKTECVSFILSFIFCIQLLIYLHIHPIIHLPIYVPTHPSIHSALSVYPLTHPQPANQTPVTSSFWPSSHPSIHLPIYSSQLFICPSNLL